ncbi:hypothetical protein, partial [Ferrovibrio sp.]|uniref:hypothetical protein n=1 Tax=Ferrovibrio sp. TaxID=1917215 RepID=UPI003517EB41
MKSRKRVIGGHPGRKGNQAISLQQRYPTFADYEQQLQGDRVEGDGGAAELAVGGAVRRHRHLDRGQP